MILNEITGYIEIPFHGEKGDSAYDIAVKYGYEGTEEDWLNSLGFIPDKSIGEEKLSDAMVGKLREYEDIISSMLDKEDEYKECFANEYNGLEMTQANATAEVWINSLPNYTAPYFIKGIHTKNMVLLPQLSTTLKVFDETNASMWSTASSMYHLAKIDVSACVGKSVRIYGRSQAASYPLAFCVDSDGNILERYGTDTYTWYGYFFNGGSGAGFTATDPVETVVPDGAKYIYIQGGFNTINGTVAVDALPRLEVMAETYKANELYKLMQSPLWGKKLYVDGDSICYGASCIGGYGKIIADKFNMELVNKGVSGATICTGVTDVVSFGTELDWENTQYYFKIGASDPINSPTNSEYIDGLAYPITKEIYENGFGVYPTLYRLVDGAMVEREYTETLPQGKFYIKFDEPTYGGNTVPKYYGIWCYANTAGELTGNYWLWEAYKSGFKTAHETQKTIIGKARHWLSRAAEEIPTDADYIIFEGGVNDYQLNRRLGEITADYTSVVDTSTVIGGMEYVCRQMLEKGIGKKVLFVLTHKVNKLTYTENTLGGTAKYKTLTDYHDAIVSVLKKYSIPCVDLFNNSAFNTDMESYKKFTGGKDGVHPTKEGYELFYVPKIVSVMESI